MSAPGTFSKYYSPHPKWGSCSPHPKWGSCFLAAHTERPHTATPLSKNSHQPHSHSTPPHSLTQSHTAIRMALWPLLRGCAVG
eukprot:113739-Alexandrium_andersonii.AAC.1